MTMLEVLALGIGGFFGAMIRFGIGGKFNREHAFPFGTLFVNLVGSFLIGLIVGVGLPRIWMFLLVSGLLGALTTFSTVQKEVIEQWQRSEWKQAAGYIALTYGGGILLAMIGYIVVI